jgi:hypothetical protein
LRRGELPAKAASLGETEVVRANYEQGCLFEAMGFPVKVCSICGEEFELKPAKPGFANRCPECSVPDEADTAAKGNSGRRQVDSELNAARRKAMRELLYRKDS